jgi:hypothetical protein
MDYKSNNEDGEDKQNLTNSNFTGYEKEQYID